ncbi:unknown [Roseburia sp. CAG:303]|nr:unknown [Roseburia sp. CAG:303]
MSSWKEKIQSSKKKIQKSIHSKSFWKHFFLMAVIVLAAGIVLSMIPAKVTTINDMAIRYTEPRTEELETEGFAEETEAEQSQDVPQDSTADAPAAEETVAEPAPEETTGMAYIPEAQVKLPMLSTNHRPWILSDLSDMFHSLSQQK